ncbi:transcription factor TGA9-like [Hibiscus syriacus]|uniref:transcription factor TGA9-like n=1 Tax=Hibiscus syriacus TaxID=106335 RepID=UPI001922ECA2|nr:transcription factor TGA9-like [Hibiscus syriacus]
MANHHLPYENGMNVSTSFINQEEPAFDFRELEEAIVMQGMKSRDEEEEAKATLLTAGRTAAGAGLKMFPTWPMRFHQTPIGSSKSGGESTHSSSSSYHQAFDQHHLHQQQQEMASDPSTKLIQSSEAIAKSHQDKKKASTSEKQLDAKTQRRLAQNREAARKSRLRKKAYVQQLESSRIKLTQLEQELQRAGSQGVLLASNGGAVGNMNSEVEICDMEYARWLEEDERHMSDLRTGLQSNLSDSDLRLIVDAYISHYDEIFRLKGMAAKFDVFHLLTGMWTTPAERCFLWMGGFRPSELIKMLISQLDPLTEQQLVGIYSLQHSSQQAEEALTQGLEQLQQSLIETVAGSLVVDGMQQMATALNKLANLEGFVRQADNLRQQTLHQLPRILTVRQAARCFLVIGEYYGRLRALSSLWASRPRGRLMGEEQSWQTTESPMVQPSQSQFSHF